MRYLRLIDFTAIAVLHKYKLIDAYGHVHALYIHSHTYLKTEMRNVVLHSRNRKVLSQS